MSKKKDGFPNYRGYSQEEKELKCKAFFVRLTEELKKTHTSMGSCNKDSSVYLVPNGTEDQVTYKSKPQNSFRISDHWNWKASLRKQPIEGYVQCFTRDLPCYRKRREEGKASMPIWAWQIGYFGEDAVYHCVYGERFNRETKIWDWVEADPAEVAKMAINAQKEAVA